jgi:hypothetical protein
MAVIVRHKKTLKKFIFLGAGYGTYKATRPSFIGGNLFPDEEEGETRIVAVCDKDGNIIWFSPDKLRVIEVDGVKLENLNHLFDEEKEKNVGLLETCPACGAQVSIYEKKCPDCGITFVDSEYDKISQIAKQRNRSKSNK